MLLVRKEPSGGCCVTGLLSTLEVGEDESSQGNFLVDMRNRVNCRELGGRSVIIHPNSTCAKDFISIRFAFSLFLGYLANILRTIAKPL